MNLWVCDAGHLRTNRTQGTDTCSELVFGGVGGRACGRDCTRVSDHARTVVTLAVRAYSEENGGYGVHAYTLDVLRDLGWPGAGSWRA